ILLNKVREFEQGFLPDVCTPELLAAVERLRTDIVTAGEIAELKKLLGGNRTEPPRTGRTGYGAQRRPGAGYRQVPRPYRP
ncbi:MAG: hypothetical protein LBS99_05465, partial [Clostridiales bacterium]|nr:hypothetical protein [Clostridiales bacterium]